MQSSTKITSADELFEMGDIGRCELVNGGLFIWRQPELNTEKGRAVFGGRYRVCRVVDPPNQKIDVFGAAGSVSGYRGSDEWRDEKTLPGFALRLDELFSSVR